MAFVDKENVQPAPRGLRKGGLKQATEKNPAKRYEQAIQQYRGDDPLSPWIDYIHWTQKTFESNEEELRSHLLPLVVQCTKQFQDDPRYQNSKKYLRLWIVYADMCENPEEVFHVLTAKGIGSRLAMYYQAYALVKENLEQFQEADQLYMAGLTAQAEPLASLVQTYSAFKERWSLQQQEESKDLQQQQQQQQQQLKRAHEAQLSAPNKRPAVAPVATTRDYEVAYASEVIVHPATGEEICFEEYRMLCRARNSVAPSPVAPISERAAIQSMAMLGSNMLNTSPANQGGIHSFLCSSPAPVLAQHDAVAAPTPTMCTKLAMQDVYDMFRDSPGFSSSSLTDEIGIPAAAASPGLRPSCSPIAFTVFADEDDAKEDPSPATPAIAAVPERHVHNTLTPILETSHDSETPVGLMAPIQEDAVVDPLSAAVRAKALPTLLSLPGVENQQDEEAPFALEAILDESEQDLELADHLMHVEGSPTTEASGVVRLMVQDLDAEEPAQENLALKINPHGGEVSMDECAWEFFVSQQLLARVPQSSQTLLVTGHKLHLFKGMSCLLAYRADKQVYLQDVLRAYQTAEKTMSATLVLFYSIELLRVLDAVHAADVMHCNITPETLLLRDERCEEWADWQAGQGPGWAGKGLALGDWRHAVDLRQHSSHTTFSSKSLPAVLSNAACMKSMAVEGRRHQLDRAQVACVIHAMRCGPDQALDVVDQGNGRLGLRSPIKGPLGQTWTDLVEGLLGNASLASLRAMAEAQIAQSPDRVKAVKIELCKQNILICD